MINLDARYHDYLHSNKKICVDGVEESVKAYGYNCDGSDIIGYYITTNCHKLYYDLQENFLRKELVSDTSKV
jgi:hypothetical protein|tara:strand:- start:13075 stop:13290 length:216 start_codon:yes stop_codon:yes gene_type:complete